MDIESKKELREIIEEEWKTNFLYINLDEERLTNEIEKWLDAGGNKE